MSGNQDELGLAARLTIGAIAGFVATMAMTGAMRRLYRALPAKAGDPPGPRGSTDRVPAPPAAIAPDLSLAVHFAYGAGCGALLAAANPRVGRLGGALAGGGVWLASHMGWIPAFGIPKPAAGHPPRRDLGMLRAHLAWGWSTAAAIRELGAARATLFAAGRAPNTPDRPVV